MSYAVTPTTICFDLDGTLTDSKLGITRCIQHALIELTGNAPEANDLTWCIGPPLLNSFETLLDDKTLAPEALTKYRRRFSEIGIYENVLYPGIPKVLSDLKNLGYQLIVTTSKPTVYASRIVDHFKLLQFFDEVHGSQLDGTYADKTELLAWVLKQHQLDADQTTMIGDRRHDIIGAHNNKMHAIGVLYGYGTRDELTKAGANTFCEAPEQLLDVFK